MRLKCALVQKDFYVVAAGDLEVMTTLRTGPVVSLELFSIDNLTAGIAFKPEPVGNFFLFLRRKPFLFLFKPEHIF